MRKASVKYIRLIAVALTEAITLGVLVHLIHRGAEPTQLLLTAATFLLVLLPEAAERLFKCRLATPLYLFCLFYAIGPMFGHSLNWYQLVPGWDKVLHVSGGVVFTLLGLFLFQKLSGRDREDPWLMLLFAVFFSLGISVLWEFVEYGADQLLGMDMQNDTVVTSIRSFYLGGSLGEVGQIPSIGSTVLDGVQMPWNGYLDIGLHDTMQDMLVEAIGTLLTAGIYLLDGTKHTWIRFKK